MTPEAQRIAIAEACGWEYHTNGGDGNYKGWIGPNNTFRKSMWRPWFKESELPDYLNSLDACHEMEMRLGEFESHLYSNHLFNLLKPHQIDSADNEKYGAPQLAWPGVYQMIHAAAAQRCEAFLKTIGKWEEGQ